MEFRILGPFEVLDDGASVDLGAPKQRAVLAVLLLHANEVVPTDRLVDLVWGEDPPRTAAHSVQIYVSDLRKALGGNGEMIVTRRPGYALEVDADHLDACRFERLVDEARAALRDGDQEDAASIAERALGFWHGPPLADFVYDEFAQREIQRLEELHERAVATVCEAYLASGRPLDAVPMLRDAVRRDPLGEDQRRLLMLALYAGGRQPDALREFRDYRDVLAEETGLDPSPGLLRIEEQILLRDSSLLEAAEDSTPRRAERNPYKGLQEFNEADAGYFFGRDELVDRLLAACSARLASVVGPSGSGKSSVVRAGLVPRLREAGVAGSERWTIVTMLPGRYPFAEFDAAMARATGGSCQPCDPSDDGSITRSAVRCLTGETGVVLIVIDQFEELFTLTDEPIRRAFLRNLVTAVNDPHGRIRVLLTIRADFYDRPLMYPEFAGLFTENIVNVIPLTPAGIEAASVEPARMVGVGFAPDLLAEVVSDMADQPGALPLFQYVLTELFDERDGSTMALDAYLRIGGLTGSLSRRADAVYESLEAADRETARAVFVRLVKPTEDRYTRRPVPVLELESIAEGDAVSNVLTRFGGERLLIFDRDSRTGAATVEVAHEALLSGWGRLAAWLEDARVDIAELDGLLVSAAEWEATGRDPGYLLAGARLNDYESWQESTPIALPPDAVAYLDESIRARREAETAESERLARETKVTRRAHVRLWGMLAALVTLVAVVTFVVLTSIANRPPSVAFLYAGEDFGGWNSQMHAGLDRASQEYGLDVAIKTSSEFGVPYELESLVESKPDLVINGMASVMAVEAEEIEQEHPEIRFVHPDIGQFLGPEEIDGNPHISFPVFPVHEASFLVGVAAARSTKTGIVGFIGAIDIPLIRTFEGGFTAGVEYVASETGTEIEVMVDYLTPSPWFDNGAFSIPSLAFQAASEMHASDADVIYTAAGSSGFGSLLAARMSTEASGVHRWHIGVDQDEYLKYEAMGSQPLGPVEASDLLPYILTSMEKKIGVSVYDAVSDYHNGDFASGIRVYGLAEDAVGYSTSGGHIDDLIPELEKLKGLIVAGEIDVPLYPPGYEPPAFGEVG